jgi:cation diffusion facilitator CzcD-associated flavoprotein CzcO
MEQQRVKRVAVIGAGISGVATAAHLKNAGIEVTVFERNRASGGSWYGCLVKVTNT